MCTCVSATKLPFFSAEISNTTVGQCYTMWMLFVAWKRHTVCTNGIHIIVIFSIFSFIVVAVVLPWQKRTQLLALNILTFAKDLDLNPCFRNIYSNIAHTHFTPASPMFCLCISYTHTHLLSLQCDVGKAILHLFDLIHEERNLVALVVHSCTEVLKVIGELAANLQLLVVNM